MTFEELCHYVGKFQSFPRVKMMTEEGMKTGVVSQITSYFTKEIHVVWDDRSAQSFFLTNDFHATPQIIPVNKRERTLFTTIELTDGRTAQVYEVTFGDTFRSSIRPDSGIIFNRYIMAECVKINGETITELDVDDLVMSDANNIIEAILASIQQIKPDLFK